MRNQSFQVQLKIQERESCRQDKDSVGYGLHRCSCMFVKEHPTWWHRFNVSPEKKNKHILAYLIFPTTPNLRLQILININVCVCTRIVKWAKGLFTCRCAVNIAHTRTQLCLEAQGLIWARKPEHWPISYIWRPGNYLCKSPPIKRKTNKGGLVKQAPFSSTLHLETVTERAGEIG